MKPHAGRPRPPPPKERIMDVPTPKPPRRRPIQRIGLALAVAAAALGIIGASTVVDAQNRQPNPPKPTVVLVHGAFADASGWTAVVDNLQSKGYDVIAPSNPLRGLPTDVRYLRDFLATIHGPIVLVGHSYGGMVITNAATGNDDVKALVYIAAFAPDTGDSVAALSASAPGSLLGPATLTIRPYVKADGTPSAEGYINPADYRDVFAADLPRSTTTTLSVMQKPADLSILSDTSGEPAWKTIPSWYLVAKKDRAIPADAERAMAARAGSTTVEVNASHSVAASQPAAVTDLIVSAARSVR
jgi:pimeloyl-ACP methyl ester carboxylesterase